MLASLHEAEPHHEACSALLLQGGHALCVHALAEVFSTLTGGTQGLRVGADLAQRLLRESVLPYVKTVTLAERDVMAALAQAPSRGVRAGAVYDDLHLVAARKSGAEALVTLDTRPFSGLLREGDPRVEDGLACRPAQPAGFAREAAAATGQDDLGPPRQRMRCWSATRYARWKFDLRQAVPCPG